MKGATLEAGGSCLKSPKRSMCAVPNSSFCLSALTSESTFMMEVKQSRSIMLISSRSSTSKATRSAILGCCLLERSRLESAYSFR